MKKIKKLITSILYFLISIFVQTSKKCIIFESGEFLYDNSFYLYKYLKQFRKLKLYYVVYSDCEKDFALKNGINTKFLIRKYNDSYSNRLKTYALYKKASLFFITFDNPFEGMNISLNKKQKVINLRHSQFPWKNTLNYYKRLEKDYKSVNKIYFRLGTRESFNYLAKNFKEQDWNFLFLPMPRNENMLVDKTISFSNLTSKKIKSTSKCILFMTTFKTRDKKSYFRHNFPIRLNENDFSEINEYLQKNDMFLLIKLHHVNCLTKDDDFIKKNDHIIVLTTDDFQNNKIFVNEIFQYTDALVTDYSSALFDYLYIDKPIGFALGDREKYEKESGFSVPFDKFIVGPVFTNKYEMIDFFSQIKNGVDNYKEQRHSLHVEFNGTSYSGNYSQAIAEKFIDKKYLK